MNHEAKAYEQGPMRVLTAWLPYPAQWDKHSRVNTTIRERRRFLVPEARAYRAEVARIVRPVLPARPWFDAAKRWEFNVVTLQGLLHHDADRNLGGLLDDLVETGLVKDDAQARYGLIETIQDSGDVSGIWVCCRQRAE